MKKILYYSFVALFGVLMFASCEDVPMPYEMPTNPSTGGGGTTSEPSGSGTADDPYNVAAALEIISAMSSDDETGYIYVKGIISNIREVDPSYGNATYYISDDGTTSNQLYIYRSYYLDNAKFTSTDQIQLGDEVVIYGKFVNYYGSTPETSSGNSYIYSLNGQTSGTTSGTTEGKGSGTVDDPYNVAAALNIITALSSSDETDYMYVEGIISSINSVDVSYGNATYYISDDGTSSNQLYVYRGMYLNNERFTSADQISVGDKVVIYGKFVNYQGNTPETKQNDSYIYSLEHNGESSGGGEGHGYQPDDPYTASEAISVAEGMSSSETKSGVYVKGIISRIDEVSTSFGNATYFISDDGTTGNQLEIYRGYYLNSDKFTSESQIKIGDEVIVTGDLVNFYGNTPELTTGNHIYSINGEGGDSGDGGGSGGDEGGVTISGTTVTLSNEGVTAGSTTAYINMDIGVDNATSVDGQSFTFDDGSTVTFAKNGGNNAPTYYTATKGIRVYALNTLTFSCSKKIANIVMTCDSASGTDYVGNSTATVEFSDTGAVYCNNHTSTSGGTQLRVQTITINYAE